MVGKCTRIEKIEIENFKNVKYGQVVLKNNRKDYKASILGIYGQNGSGKTALIDAIKFLKLAFCGQVIPPWLLITFMWKQSMQSSNLIFQ